jgi:hypothetical protein
MGESRVGRQQGVLEMWLDQSRARSERGCRPWPSSEASDTLTGALGFPQHGAWGFEL